MLSYEDDVRMIVEQMNRTLQKEAAGEIQYRFRLAKDPKELRDDIAESFWKIGGLSVARQSPCANGRFYYCR